MSRLTPLLLLTAPALGACGVAADRPPDVVLVVLDTFRADLVGAEEPVTPFLDSLATESAVFPWAFSTSSWTAPSTASLLTGVYPDRHGVLDGFVARVRGNKEEAQDLRLSPIPSTVPTLAELLRARGYATFGIATNINIGGELGFSRGFDRFRREADWPAERVAELLEEWLADLRSARPFFLYLHLNDTHEPYDRRGRWIEAGSPHTPEERRYRSEAGYLDHHLERMLSGLDLDEALLVVATDHGEEFGDHGGIGHHLTLYDEVNRILCLFRGPELSIAAGRREGAVSGIDVAPTILELLGVAPAEGAHDGVSLLPGLLEGTTPAAVRDRALLAHRRGNDVQLHAAIEGGWKLIRGPKLVRRGDLVGVQRDVLSLELFDLRSDPGEATNLARSEPQRVRALLQRIEEYEAREVRTASEPVDVEMTDELLEQLVDLGYIDDGGDR